jgi:hypothetical protein
MKTKCDGMSGLKSFEDYEAMTNENKTAYEFMYNTLNIDSNTFNTTI